MPTLTNLFSGRSRYAVALMLTASLTVLATACGDESTEPEDVTLLGTWNATSFQALGTDLIADGLGLTARITGTETSGTLAIDFDNDVDEMFCDDGVGPVCTQEDPFTATATQITLDPGGEDEETFNYAITGGGNTMTWSGTIDSAPILVTFQRA